MHARVGFVGLVFVFVTGCAGSAAPTDTAPSATTQATTPATVVAPPPPSASVATPPAPVAAVDPNVCPLGKTDTWNACVGKVVELRGKTPKFVYQHPMMAPMGLPGGGAPKIHQSYMEVSEGNQIIVLSREPDKCSGPMRVKGSLRAIDLGGPEKTKESYRGWAIDDATIVCE